MKIPTIVEYSIFEFDKEKSFHIVQKIIHTEVGIIIITNIPPTDVILDQLFTSL